ncbi:MAG: glycoside hydrolase family 97 protein [Prevotella sp.]|nr:glycoside hydrolase family 97 protein [Prevotella sp.]
MRKTVLLLFALMGLAGTAQADQVTSSPDGRIALDLNVENGQAAYQVSYSGKVIIGRSALGLVTNMGDFSRDLTLGEIKTRDIKESYTLRNIKQSQVDYEAREVQATLKQGNRDVMTVTFRVSNRDVAFRYTILPRRGRSETLSCVVSDERTAFQLPADATTFMPPQSKPMTGFARTAPSYETTYTIDEPVGKNGWGNGYTFPCLFKIPAAAPAPQPAKKGKKAAKQAEQPLWVLVSETGTDGDYVGCRLLNVQGGQYKIGFPQAEEGNGWGSTSVSMALPGNTPWRTITLGTLKDVVETTVAWDVVAPKYQASKNYEYGKGSWSWIIGMDSSCNFDEQRRYIDFSAQMGYRSVLVDALWDKQIGYERIAELARYGKTKGVGLYLWYNSNGSWNDAPQSPRGIMNKAAKRRQEMKWMKETGILGIKVDFFGGDKQDMMRLYEDILSDANDFGLLVIFHGCTLPRGWERMYPNYAASEAILASENLHFSQGFCDNEARDCGTMYPFTRNVVGSMDFGGSALNKFYGADNKRGKCRVTSDVYALATAVIFQSAVQHFALAPNNLTDAPAWAIDFMKQVPTTWDEVRFIDGYPGKYILMARRSADKWYIAGVNASEGPIKQTLSLPMFSGTVNLYQNNQLSQVKISKKGTIDIEIPTNGGIVITQ